MRKLIAGIIAALTVAATLAPIVVMHTELDVPGVTYAECMHMGGRYVSGTCADVDY